METYVNSLIDDLIENCNSLKSLSNKIVEIADACVEAIKSGNKIIVCGNGGSASQAQQIVMSMVCKCKKERKAIPAIAITSDMSTITAISNDFGFETIFARQIEAIGNSGDIFIGLSTSGNSKNVVSAFELAKTKGLKTVALIGKSGSKMDELANYSLVVPAKTSAHIQELHIAVGNILCDLIEQKLFA